jgi:hypothetical protein
MEKKIVDFVVHRMKLGIEERIVINKFRYYKGISEMQDSLDSLIIGAKLCDYKVEYRLRTWANQIVFRESATGTVKLALVINTEIDADNHEFLVHEICGRKFADNGLFEQVNHDKLQPIEWLKGLL